jgi:hypothetical protein
MRRFAAILVMLLAGLAPAAPVHAAEEMSPKKAGDLAGQCVTREAARLTGGTQADAGTVAATVCRTCQPDFATFAEAFARGETRAGHAVDRTALNASVVQLCLKRAAAYAEKGIATRKELEKTYGTPPGAVGAKPASVAPAKPGPGQDARTKAAAMPVSKPATPDRAGQVAQPVRANKPVSVAKPVPAARSQAKPATKPAAKPSGKVSAKAKPAVATTAATGTKSGAPSKAKPKPKPNPMPNPMPNPKPSSKPVPASPARPAGQT